MMVPSNLHQPIRARVLRKAGQGVREGFGVGVESRE
jgi:hypothetical protein